MYVSIFVICVYIYVSLCTCVKGGKEGKEKGYGRMEGFMCVDLYLGRL